MSGALPDQLDPLRAIRAGSVFAGTLPVRRFDRLTDAIAGLGGSVDPQISYELRFERRSDGRAVVAGFVKARLVLTCQRCLTPVEMAIDESLSIGLVRTDEAAQELPDDLDPLVIVDDVMHPLALIEDELLLCIPTVPRHEFGACPAGAVLPADEDAGGLQVVAGVQADEPSASAPANPFAVLASLKHG